MNYRFLLLGVVFAALWASAAASAKLALPYVQPLVLYQIRFFLAGILLIGFSVLVKKDRLPKGEEWKHLAIFGLLNTTLYLSLFIVALQEISAGIGSLSTSTNTLFIAALSSVWLRSKVKMEQWIALFLGLIGVVIACLPLLEDNFATPRGLVLILLSMLAYSVGTIYYSKINWKLSRTAINGWQVMIGGILMLPLTWLYYKPEANTYNPTVFISVLWLVIPVSVLAVQIWLYLLKRDTVSASYFLFLCPIFGFIYANLLLDEPITWYTWVGTAMVLVALYLGQKKKARS